MSKRVIPTRVLPPHPYDLLKDIINREELMEEERKPKPKQTRKRGRGRPPKPLELVKRPKWGSILIQDTIQRELSDYCWKNNITIADTVESLIKDFLKLKKG